MKKGSNRASGGEMKDKIKPIVCATTQQGQDVRMTDMTNCPNLC